MRKRGEGRRDGWVKDKRFKRRRATSLAHRTRCDVFRDEFAQVWDVKALLETLTSPCNS
jgi:hypothetical protein